MKIQADYFNLPTAYPSSIEVLFMEQVHYPTTRPITFYTFPEKEDCGGDYCVAIWTIKKKITPK